MQDAPEAEGALTVMIGAGNENSAGVDFWHLATRH
jgi:hypothetical protein